MENRSRVLSKEPKKAIVVTAILVALAVFVGTFGGTWYWAFTTGQTYSWDLISANEENLRDLHSNSARERSERKGWRASPMSGGSLCFKFSRSERVLWLRVFSEVSGDKAYVPHVHLSV